ncbi:general secretion pathway protein GspA [Rhizorhabdus dicambivorans]|uniref:General secretion pathway protein GspA n=2 Tax=Rhizorhabdus dicambivorans TaxID=1850238 RepID=A0A2A4FWZ5_9SPHN|nr:general secretion pathway protein GspA [Rhizorhabdus dicambivorans]PCE42695.1 general secretion pathway protein GspA [Rhizorhabdus dicambivorans]
MTYLGYGLAQGEGFIVVTGEVGTGKTMLVGRLMATIDRSRLTAINLVSTQLEGEDILRIVALALGVATDVAAKGQLLARIERFLHEQARGGKRTLLIVDEAQNLPISALEELRMLSNFQYGGQALLQIFLLGQPEFRDALAQPRFEQLRQRVIATHHLTAMGPDEVAPYIMHRLACAGWKGTPRFTQDAYAAFHRLSGGIPRRLNMLAGRVMLQGAIERLIDIDGEVVEDVAADLASESIMPAEGPQPRAQAMPPAWADTPSVPPLPVDPVPPQDAQPSAFQPPASQPPAAPPPAAPTRPPGLPSYDSYAPPEEEPASPAQSAPVTSWSVEQQDPFAHLPSDIPPPSMPQPPRYDGYVPPEAAPPPPFAPDSPLISLADPEPERAPPPAFHQPPQPAPAEQAWQPPVPPPYQPAAVQPAAMPPMAAPPPPEPPQYAPQPAPPAPQPAISAVEADLVARNAELEARLAEQEEMLRRTLSLLAELVENDPPPQSPQGGNGGNQDAA